MVSLKKYFRNTNEEFLAESCVALGFDDSESSSLDDEARAAAEYLKAVRAESREQPFAIVADIESETVDRRDVLTRPLKKTIARRPEAVRDAIKEYFLSLRDLVRRELVERREVLVDFGPDVTVLGLADTASVASGLEDLSELLTELDEKVVSEWLFALLVHAERPLLEDTAAALQVLRRYCEARGDVRELEVSSIVIGEVFGQY